jgi:hypothetical protein
VYPQIKLLQCSRLQAYCSKIIEKEGVQMLTEMLNQSDTLTTYPLPQKRIIMTLASRFQTQTNLLFMNPEELEEYTELGNRDQWSDLLKLQETKNFIKGQMAALSGDSPA